jgi:hypothetical protein
MVKFRANFERMLEDRFRRGVQSGIQELKKLTDERPSDPWHEFTEACRAEREGLLKRL